MVQIMKLQNKLVPIYSSDD